MRAISVGVKPIVLVTMVMVLAFAIACGGSSETSTTATTTTTTTETQTPTATRGPGGGAYRCWHICSPGTTGRGSDAAGPTFHYAVNGRSAGKDR